jgi:Bacterial SH3 domain/L,D-transpeptidase catalytic domain
MLKPSLALNSRSFIVVLICVIAATGALSNPSTASIAKAAESSDIQPVATATSDTLVWLRAEPDSESKVISKIKSGTQVTLLDGPTKGGWYLVRPTGKTGDAGWLSDSRLIFDHFAMFKVDGALHAQPFDESQTLTTLAMGTVLTIAGPKVGAFATVRYGDDLGYAELRALEPSSGPATVPPPPEPTGEWWVDVNRSTWIVNLMIGDTAIATYSASLSRDPGNGFYGTAVGTYYIYEKIEGLQYTTYAKGYFMYWAGFDPYRFNGFHSWTMNSSGYVRDGGWGPTNGCVSTAPADALAIYNFVSVGTRVEIHW